MPGVQIPPLRRRRLGQELRQLRDAARLTIEEVAQRLEVSPAKIARIETGRVSVRPRDVSDLLDQYEVQGTHRENLLTLTREARQQGWWHSYSDVLSEGTDIWVGLETEAEAIRLFEVQVSRACSKPRNTQGPFCVHIIVRSHLSRSNGA